MPRAVAIKVQSAAKNNRWTLGRDNTPVQSPQAAHDKMQANGHYFDQRSRPLPRFSDYDGSHYDGSHYNSSHDSMASGSASGRESDGGWKKPESLHMGEFDAFDFHQTPMNELGFDLDDRTPREERRSLNLNTNVRVHNPDVVARHLLYETALLDTQAFDILEIAEVDALKKEQERLNSRIEAAQRKLQLESKVRNAAQNLQRLYSTNKRPDTPQSPESPKKLRNSLLPNGRSRGLSNSRPETFQQAENELASSVKKVDDLHDQITDLLNRRQEVERKLLGHTAAVLAEEANRVAESAVPGVANGHRFDDEDGTVGYAYSDFDGIRDILHGKPAGASNSMQQQEEQLARMQDKLENLNNQLRNVISQAGQTLGRTPAAEVGLDQSDDSAARIDNRFARLEQNLRTLDQQQRDIKGVAEQHLDVLQQQERDLKAIEDQYEETERQFQNRIEGIEEHLEGVNGQLHNALLQASDHQPIAGLQEPPRAGEHGYEEQLQYMEEGLLTMEQLLQQRSQTADLLDAQATVDELSKKNGEYEARVENLSKKNGEYEAVVGGLWDILQADNITSPRADQDDEHHPASPLKEPFSLQAFNSRVQHIFERAQSAREQQDILRRQIQQQRELGGKSDMEKEQQIADIQGRHDKLFEEHGTVQRELSSLMVKHEQAETEANTARSEHAKITEEVEELKRSVQTKQQERDEVAQHTESLQQHIEELEAEVEELMGHRDDTEAKHSDLESEVVRLTTELTMAKAELDGAYGTRAERAGAQAAEVSSLSEKNREMNEKNDQLTSELTTLRSELETLRATSEKHREMNSELESLRTEVSTLRPSAEAGERATQLERELQEMTNEFQELTKESIALEREREQLDALIDSLRDRCDELESRVADERLQRSSGKGVDGERELRHMHVLKQEFKKMMREQKAEGVKLLRAEQDERRKLEGELRKIRQASSPLAKRLSLEDGRSNGTSTPA